MNKLLDRFVSYVSIDTQSKPNTRSIPSTEGQMKLACELKNELISLGLSQVILTERGYVMATLPANVSWQVPTIGFIAHLDTSPDFSGKNVVPQIIEKYRGGDIALGIGDEVLSPVFFPILHQVIGQTLIVADGNTLLGADGKAGIAEIITAMVRLKERNIPHGEIRISFTPDSEVGKGASYFDIKTFAAEWAYTVAGTGVGELESENFNTATATIKITGHNAELGNAKNVMTNALILANQFYQCLPEQERPENTGGKEGFFHLQNLKGTVERAELHYLICDFSRETFEQRKAFMLEQVKIANTHLPKHCSIDINIVDNYYNMSEIIAKHSVITELAEEAIRECQLKFINRAIRGGTDGAKLSFNGLPCPNISAGGYHYHTRHEFVTLEAMEASVTVIMKIAELTAKRFR